MICPKCGATIKGGYRYVTCPNCGRTYDSTQFEKVEEPAPRTAPAPEFVLSPTSESEHGPAPASKPLVQSNSYKNDKQVSFPSKQLVTDIHKELPLKSSFSLKNILIVAVGKLDCSGII